MLEVVRQLIGRLGPREFAQYIDSTLLSAETPVDIALRYIEDARACGFRCVVLSPYHSIYVLSRGFAKDVDVCSVVGFPMGYIPTKVKVLEVEELLSRGVKEVDVVMNIQAFKSGRYDDVLEDLMAVVDTVRRYNALVKVIIEFPLLTDDEKEKAIEIAIRAGAHFVKTSTGVLSKTSLHDVYTLVKLAKGRIKVKAAGGFRNALDTLLAIAIGAERIGTSTALQIYREFLKLKSLPEINLGLDN